MYIVSVLPDRLDGVSPAHWMNRDPGDGVAVSFTEEFGEKPAEQLAPQLMPPLSLVTVPVPLPNLETVSVFCCGGGGGAGVYVFSVCVQL